MKYRCHSGVYIGMVLNRSEGAVKGRGLVRGNATYNFI